MDFWGLLWIFWIFLILFFIFSFKFFFLAEKKKKNAIPLVLPIEEISLRPELSSPARFRFQGGPLSVTDGRTHERTEILLSNLGLDAFFHQLGPTGPSWS